MSSNIYEKPNSPMNVRYSKGARVDRGERIERRVDIYESVDTLREHRANISTQGGGARTQRHLPAVQGNPFRAAAVILGLLCLALVTGNTVLFKLYISISLERDELKINNSNLGNNYAQLQTEVNKLRGDITGKLCPEGWERIRCGCYYKSTEMKSWNDSRADCKKREGDLVVINSREEHDSLGKLYKDGTYWIGLQRVKTHINWEEWKWQWVDGSTPINTFWAKEQPLKFDHWSAVSVDGGKWIINDESKQWICEKEIS